MFAESMVSERFHPTDLPSDPTLLHQRVDVVGRGLEDGDRITLNAENRVRQIRHGGYVPGRSNRGWSAALLASARREPDRLIASLPPLLPYAPGHSGAPPTGLPFGGNSVFEGNNPRIDTRRLKMDISPNKLFLMEV